MSHLKDSPSLRSILTDRRFWPLFWTQALGAFNDNVFKNAIVILITFKSATLFGLSSEKLVALCGGIFILPFFLFSAVAGKLADQRSKSDLSRFTKIWEILVMILGAVGFALDSLPLLLGALFMLGMQATFFGPIKYGIVSELLGKRELVGGNALIENLEYSRDSSRNDSRWNPYGTRRDGTPLGLLRRHRVRPSGLPHQPKDYSSPCSRSRAKGFTKSDRADVRPLRLARNTPSVFLSILAISWFWLLGSIVLSVLPTLCKDTLGGSESVLTLFLAIFSIGVGFGSILCERFSFGSLELALVPIGSIGMSLFALDIGILPMPHTRI